MSSKKADYNGHVCMEFHKCANVGDVKKGADEPKAIRVQVGAWDMPCVHKVAQYMKLVSDV